MLSGTQTTTQSVRDYYGRVLKSNKDLKTSACCLAEALPPRIRAILTEIHPEVLEKFYGCGSPIPPALDGKTVLDLGSGSGRDCFVCSGDLGDSRKTWSTARITSSFGPLEGPAFLSDAWAFPSIRAHVDTATTGGR